MTTYAIRCETPGENVLAQKILFKKGWYWMSSGESLVLVGKGQTICISKSNGFLTRLGLYHSDANLKERGFQVINMSELRKL